MVVSAVPLIALAEDCDNMPASFTVVTDVLRSAKVALIYEVVGDERMTPHSTVVITIKPTVNRLATDNPTVCLGRVVCDIQDPVEWICPPHAPVVRDPR